MKQAKYLNAVLTVIALLLALNLWVGAHHSPAAAALDPAHEALAQGRTDSGAQRAKMIEQLSVLNDKIDAMSKKLTDGSVKVSVTSMPERD